MSACPLHAVLSDFEDACHHLDDKHIILQKIDDLSNHVFHHFVVRLLNINRDKLIKELDKKNFLMKSKNLFVFEIPVILNLNH